MRWKNGSQPLRLGVRQRTHGLAADDALEGVQHVIVQHLELLASLFASLSHRKIAAMNSRRNSVGMDRVRFNDEGMQHGAGGQAASKLTARRRAGRETTVRRKISR